MLVLTIKDNALVGFRNEENGYALEPNEQAATINGTVLELPSGITHIGNISDNQINGFFAENTPDDNDFLLSEYAVSAMRSITSIRLPSSVTTIKCNFFNYFPNLESISFPSDSRIKDIYPRAFANCPKLEKVEIPENADGEDVKIYVDAFVGCSNLKVIDVPENSSIHLASEEPFKGCDNLETLNIRGKAYKFPLLEKNIDKLSHGEDSIRNNEVMRFGLARDDFHKPELITEWCMDLYEEIETTCGKLARITIPSSVTSIGHDAFFEGNLTEIIIQDGVTNIGGGAFSNCQSLTNIIIPDGVTSIGEYAFSHCNALKSVKIPDGVTDIAFSLFEYCRELKEVTLPNSIEYIGEDAFSHCSGLTSVTIPAGLTYIDECAFGKCRRLTSIITCSNNPALHKMILAACDPDVVQNITFETPEEVLNQEQESGNGETVNAGSISVDDIRKCISDVESVELKNAKEQLGNEPNKDSEKISQNPDNPEDMSL